MDRVPREQLVAKVAELEDQVKLYQKRLRDLVAAHKGLLKEKEAIEAALKALQGNGVESEASQKTDADRAEIATLMASLSALSEEKSRMEASFQMDKRQLRLEKTQFETENRELRERIKLLNGEHMAEVESLKGRLMAERKARDGATNDHGLMLRELQRLLGQERETRVQLEKHIMDLELKLQEKLDRLTSDRATSAELHSLQTTYAEGVEAEKLRALDAERKAKQDAELYEQRVAGLEARLAELSLVVASYHNLRQQDQAEISRLKTSLEDQRAAPARPEQDVAKNKSDTDMDNYGKALADKIAEYKALAAGSEKHLDLHRMLCDCAEQGSEMVPLDTYRALVAELETCKRQRDAKTTELDRLSGLLADARDKLRSADEEKIALNSLLQNTTLGYSRNVDALTEKLAEERDHSHKKLAKVREEYRSQVAAVESQLRKQRERTLSLLEEKENEISTLKSSFRLFLPGNSEEPKKSEEPSDAKTSLGSFLGVAGAGESPHMLHYAHELARRDNDISQLRKEKYQLDTDLRELAHKMVIIQDSHCSKVEQLEQQIDRLERCKSRESANLEYLKNVFVNYLVSGDLGCKRHMLNAISACLKFNPEELDKILASMGLNKGGVKK